MQDKFNTNRQEIVSRMIRISFISFTIPFIGILMLQLFLHAPVMTFLGVSIVVPVLYILLSVVLLFITTDDKRYEEEPGCYFLDFQGKMKLLANFVVNVMMGYFIFNALSALIGYDEYYDPESFQLNELSLTMSVSGIFCGICNACCMFYFDRLFVSYFELADVCCYLKRKIRN